MITQNIGSVPFVEKGFGLRVNHYASGRVSVVVADHGGICGIGFVGEQHHKKYRMFKSSDVSSFAKLARMQVLIDGEAYFLEFSDTKHYPFGFSSECELAGVKFRHELVLDQDTVFQRLKVLENPETREIRARLLQHGHVWETCAGRTCEKWMVDGKTGFLSSLVVDTEPFEGKTNDLIGCDRECDSYARHEPFKYYMNTIAPADETIFYVAFNPKDGALYDSKRIDDIFADYERMLEHNLRFETGNSVLDSALNNAVPMVSNLVVKDRPGAIRASQHYWIWGWDSMVHQEAFLWGGRTDLVRDMLDFYRESADPKEGVAHAFNSDFSYVEGVKMMDNAQMLYAVMLYNYYAVTGDKETVERNVDFARLIMERAGAAISEYGSLGIGFGFYPDDRWALGHDKDDLSLINNSLFFQGLKAMEALEREFGHDVKAAKCAETAGKVKSGLESVLWDEEKGYWLDSASAKDGSPRYHYPLYGQLYVSPFGADPKNNEIARIADFMRRNFLFDAGLYMFPKTDSAFMADGNQLGAYYPTVDRYYWNIMNRRGDERAAEDLERIVTGFWKLLTYPEGLTHETVNADPTPDEPGGKQAFSAKAWFCDALELNLGLRVDFGGFSLNPLLNARVFRIHNLSLRGKKIMIEKQADVGKKTRLILNGAILKDNYVRWDMLQADNTIVIENV